MTVTNVGLQSAAELLIGAGTAFSNVAIGTGTTAFAATSTQLNNEYKRGTATTSTQTTDTTGDTSRFLYLFSFTESKAITEAAVLDASVSGNMLCAQTFAAVNVINGDSLQITFDIDHD